MTAAAGRLVLRLAESLAATVEQRSLSVAEVSARMLLTRLPQLRRKAGRWARRSKPQPNTPTWERVKDALRSLGQFENRPLIVHSSWESLAGLNVKPSVVLGTLQELAGARGTLLMPTHPALSRRTAVSSYDVAKSPSAVGLLTEALRRAPGAVRSPFPIAPMGALGHDASAWATDFRLQSRGTPYGPGSPWASAGERNAQVLFLGIDFIRANTLVHCAFDVLAERNPLTDFYEPAVFDVTWQGTTSRWEVRQQRSELEPFLASEAFKRRMRRENLVREVEVGGLFLGLMDAKAFLDWHQRIALRSGLPDWAGGWKLFQTARARWS